MLRLDRTCLVALLTALIHLTDTLAYAARLSGVRTRRLATAFSLYQVISIIAMTANMVQAPLLSSVVEQGINAGYITYHSHLENLAGDIRLIILAASAGTLAAALLTPLFVLLFSRSIFIFERVGSLPLFLWKVLSPRHLSVLAGEVVKALLLLMAACRRRCGRHFSLHGLWQADRELTNLFVTNIVVVGIWTTGVLSALFAGAMLPSFRSTATLLSGIVNGIAVVLSAFLIDPVTAMITDQAIQGRRSEGEIRHLVFWLISSRLLGTFLAQFIFLPAAYLVRYATLFLSRVS